MTFFIHFIIFFLNIKLSEEVKSYHSVNVYNNCKKHDSEHQLLSIVCDRLQNGAEGLESNSYIKQVSSKEEIVKVAQDGESKIP